MKTHNKETIHKLARLYDAREKSETIRKRASKTHNKYFFKRSCKRLESIREEIKSIEDILSINK